MAVVAELGMWPVVTAVGTTEGAVPLQFIANIVNPLIQYAS